MKRCIGLFICLIMAVLLGACSISSGDKKSEEYGINVAFVDDQGVSHLVCDSGKVLAIPNSKTALITADRRLLLWVSESGSLYRVNYSGENTDLTKADKIGSDVDDLMTANDMGLSYVDTSGALYRVLFSDNSTTKVIDDVANVASTQNMTLFISANGKVYFLPQNSKDPRELAVYSGEVSFWPLSGKNEEVVWVDYNSGAKTDTVYYFDGVNSEKLYELQSGDYGANVEVESSEDGNYVAVYSYTDNVLLLKAPKKGFVKIDFSGDLNYGIYTHNDMLGFRDSSEIDGVYVAVDQDETKSIYWVTFNGDKERILSKTINFAVCNGTIYYLTSDHTLYATTASKAVTGSGEQIVNEVDDFVVFSDYVYYMKDTVPAEGSSYDGVGTLYAYTLKDREPIKVATDVYASYYSFRESGATTSCRLKCADDGKTVLYLRNPVSRNYSVYGSLFRYTYGKEEPDRIMGEVNEYRIYSLKRLMSSDSLIVAQYIDKDASETTPYHFDWYYYNGKEAISVAKNAN